MYKGWATASMSAVARERPASPAPRATSPRVTFSSGSGGGVAAIAPALARGGAEWQAPARGPVRSGGTGGAQLRDVCIDFRPGGGRRCGGARPPGARLAGQQRDAEQIAEHGASAIADEGGGIIAKRGGRDHGRPAGAEGEEERPVACSAAQCGESRDDEGRRSGQHRRPGEGMDAERGVEDAVYMGRGGKRVRTEQRTAEPEEGRRRRQPRKAG